MKKNRKCLEKFCHLKPILGITSDLNKLTLRKKNFWKICKLHSRTT